MLIINISRPCSQSKTSKHERSQMFRVVLRQCFDLAVHIPEQPIDRG